MRPLFNGKISGMLLACGLTVGVLSGCMGNEQPNPPALQTPIAHPATGTPTGPTTVATSTAVNTVTSMNTATTMATRIAANTATTIVSIPTVIATPTAPTAAGPPAEPLMTLALNNSRDGELLQGWPLLLEISIMHPDIMGTESPIQSINIGAANSPWTGAVKVSVVNAVGEAQSWPLHMADGPEGEVMLDTEAVSTVYWWLGPEETTALAEGAYLVTAELDTSGLAGGWQGSVSSVPAILTVAGAPAAQSPEQLGMQAQMLAAQALVMGDKEQAMQHLDDLLASQPNNIAVLEFKGDLLAQEGKAAEALAAYNAALKAFYDQQQMLTDPPTSLSDKQHEMLDILLETP